MIKSLKHQFFILLSISLFVACGENNQENTNTSNEETGDFIKPTKTSVKKLKFDHNYSGQQNSNIASFGRNAAEIKKYQFSYKEAYFNILRENPTRLIMTKNCPTSIDSDSIKFSTRWFIKVNGELQTLPENRNNEFEIEKDQEIIYEVEINSDVSQCEEVAILRYISASVDPQICDLSQAPNTENIAINTTSTISYNLNYISNAGNDFDSTVTDYLIVADSDFALHIISQEFLDSSCEKAKAKFEVFELNANNNILSKQTLLSPSCIDNTLFRIAKDRIYALRVTLYDLECENPDFQFVMGKF